MGTANAGRLKGALLKAVALVRAVGGSVAPTNQRVWPFTRRSRTPLTSNSVFGFYSPLYPVSRSSEIEPEFQIYGPNEPGRRGNFHGQVHANPGGDIPVSFASRRNFLQETARLAAATGRGCIGRLNARAQTVPSSPSGYRALVGVCLLGGTDGHTRSLPMSGVARRKYLAARGSRSRPDGHTPVLPIVAKNGTPYGLNGGLAALYPFWALGKLAGVGTLGMGEADDAGAVAWGDGGPAEESLVAPGPARGDAGGRSLLAAVGGTRVRGVAVGGGGGTRRGGGAAEGARDV